MNSRTDLTPVRCFAVGLICALVTAPYAWAQEAPVPAEEAQAKKVEYRQIKPKFAFRSIEMRLAMNLLAGRIPDQTQARAAAQNLDGALQSLVDMITCIDMEDPIANDGRLLGEKLHDLRSVIANQMRTGQAPYHDQALNLLVDSLSKIALNVKSQPTDLDFAPVSRLNAVLMIGELNQREAASRNDTPVPSPAALDVLLTILDEKRVPVSAEGDALRSAALKGITRHAASKPAGPVRERIVAATRKIAETEQPPSGRSADTHLWLRRRSGLILQSLGESVALSAIPAAANN